MADINTAYGTSTGFNSTLYFDITTVHNKSSDRIQISPNTNLPDISNVDTTQYIGYVKININDLDSFDYQVYNPNADGEFTIKDGIQRHMVYQATVTNCNVNYFTFPINNINNDYFVIVKPRVKKATGAWESNSTVSTRNINVEKESVTKYKVRFDSVANTLPPTIEKKCDQEVSLIGVGALRGSPLRQPANLSVVQLEPIFKIFYAFREHQRRLTMDQSAEEFKKYQKLMNDKFDAVTVGTMKGKSLLEMDQELDKLVSQRGSDDTIITGGGDSPKLHVPPEWVPLLGKPTGVNIIGQSLKKANHNLQPKSV